MGMLRKAIAFMVGLMLVGLGAWLVALPFLLYAVWGILVRRNGSSRRAAPTAAEKRRPLLGGRTILGTSLLLLALVGLTQGGRLSVLVFGGLGAVLLLWSHLPPMGPLSWLEPMDESVLLRSAVVPILWVSVSEIRFMARNAAALLSSIDEQMIVVVTGRASVFVVLKVVALSHSAATEKVLSRLRGVASVILPEGGLVVPLDSADGAGALQVSSREVRADWNNWKRSVETTPYDCVWFSPKNGFLKAAGIFRKDPADRIRPSVSHRLHSLPRQPLLWEAFKSLESRASWPEPDELTGYIAALGAKKGEPLAQKIPGGSLDEGAIVVEGFGDRRIKMKSTQLRALLRVYR